MKNIQITQNLFVKLIKYFYSSEIEYTDEELCDLQGEIKSELQKKMDKISLRNTYTAYKTAPTEHEREEARKKYLDERGVPESFRW